ncbi:MAG: AMP-binding protein [Proteobacteria bacterium]|nr:AMP-binding protein [Pseudomonadota bacterium]MBU1450706.1 AMP-binding protein [Pseudomonadota bacterium]MBU2468645.1 AMP-binding protein [Pseudomonadota bacterium]MBU2517681.1 AMP-binding protein [Pseudomonadota bacterium]
MIGHTLGGLYDRAVQFFKDRPALIFGDTTYTYEEMGLNAARLANGLRRLGHQKGDRIAFLMSNCPEYVFCEYAAAKTGCVRVPLAVLLSGNDHVYMLNQSEAVSLIYHQKMTERVLAMIPHLETVKHFICVGPDAEAVPKGHLHLNEMMIQLEPDWGPEVEIDPEDLAGIYYTGGTTGKPKGVMLSHRAWVYTILIEMLEFEIAWNEVFAYPTPLTHAGGCLMLPVMLRGGKCVILDHFEPKLFMEAVEKNKVTATFLVPTMIYVLLDQPDLASHDLSSLRNVIYGASAIAPERLKQAINTFGPIFTQLFGQTEAPMMISCLPRASHVVADPQREREIFSSAGRPTFHAEVKLVDEQGREVAQGDSGEVTVRCANMMSGYFKNPEATAETVVDGWLHTGDIAKQDQEGFLYIVDRKKDMIISGGFNIFPREIEDVLFEHPAVKAAAVVGVPHPKWGEEVKAVVVLAPGGEASAEELIAFVKQRKGSLVVPKSLEFWPEIPLTNLGKVDKKAIRSKFWEGRDRMVS